MTNYQTIEDRAYELAEETTLTVDEIADRLIQEFDPYIGANDAQDIAEEAVYYAREEDGDWDREMGFDPYEGCYTWDC